MDDVEAREPQRHAGKVLRARERPRDHVGPGLEHAEGLGVGLDHYYETPELPMWAVAIYRVVANGLGVVGTVAPPADTGAVASATADDDEAESTPTASGAVR